MKYRSFRWFEATVPLLLALLLSGPPAAAHDSIEDSRRNALVRAVERVQPAVVSVHVVHRERVLYRYRDSLMEQLFRGSGFGPRYYSGLRDRVTGGSGFLIDGSGTVLTNAHVMGQGIPCHEIHISRVILYCFRGRRRMPLPTSGSGFQVAGSDFAGSRLRVARYYLEVAGSGFAGSGLRRPDSLPGR